MDVTGKVIICGNVERNLKSFMGKTAIVTGGTSKDVSAMGVLALNIKDRIPNLANELIIFHDGIKRKDQQLIKKIYPTYFFDYKFPIGFLAKRKNRSLRYFTPMLFCKYECFRLLEQYDRVIWTDYDVLILKDLNELIENESGLQIPENGGALRQMFLPNVGEIDMSEYDMEQSCICTPLFVITRNIGEYMEFYDWCIKATLKYAEYIDLPEQCIISMLIQKFQISYYNLSIHRYALHPKEYDGKASILHAYGRPKFWEGLYNEQWDRYYREWCQLGGSQYKEPLRDKVIKVISGLQR